MGITTKQFAICLEKLNSEYYETVNRDWVKVEENGEYSLNKHNIQATFRNKLPQENEVTLFNFKEGIKHFIKVNDLINLDRYKQRLNIYIIVDGKFIVMRDISFNYKEFKFTFSSYSNNDKIIKKELRKSRKVKVNDYYPNSETVWEYNLF